MIMSTLVNTNGRLADGSKLTPRLWAILAVVILADVLDLMDSTITNIAAPTIVQEIGGGESLIKWLRASYALAIGVLLVVGGRLATAMASGGLGTWEVPLHEASPEPRARRGLPLRDCRALGIGAGLSRGDFPAGCQKSRTTASA
jgi:MFS family permease